MKSSVYFIKNENKLKDIEKIIEESGFIKHLEENENVDLILHPLDLDDCSYISGKTIKRIVKILEEKKHNTHIIAQEGLYHNDKNIEEIFVENNFDLKNYLKEYSTIKISTKIGDFPLIKEIYENSSIILFSHFKGHSRIAFSGALKNLATRCTNKEGQIMLCEKAKPFISKIACLACNVCVNYCPEEAIKINSHANINQQLCIGCNMCISFCPTNAIKLNKLTYTELIKDYCEVNHKILENKKDNKVLFINILNNIRTYYDSNNNKKIVEDIGILASFDPVAIDKASYDLVNKNKTSEDKFKEIWRNIDGTVQFKYATELGIGLENYELIII